MKATRYIIPALAAAAALSACDKTEDLIFEESASERLETAKNEYSAALTDLGGSWMMEYFANGDEEGYLMVMEFGKDGSVNVTGNNKWLDNVMTSDRSTWEVITDDGPVLTFPSYNRVFHLFSDPNNITGPYAPTNPDLNDEDVNETGYGHNGDYEFNIMELNAAGDSLRLRGKKRGITTWLVRLPEGTDAQAHLAAVTEKASNMLSPKFTKLYLTDPEGEVFVVNGAHTGIFSAYPLDGDAVTQTHTANALITDHGVRFMNPFHIARANTEADDLVISELQLQADGSLATADGARLVAPTPVELLNNSSREWNIDIETLTGDFKEIFDKVAAAANSKWSGKRDLTAIGLAYRNLSGRGITPVLRLKFGTYSVEFYYEYVQSEGYETDLRYLQRTSNADTFVKNIPELENLCDRFISQASYSFSTTTPLQPSVIQVVDTKDGSGFQITLI